MKSLNKYSKPEGPRDQPWGTREVIITDPFNNRLIFYSAGKMA